MPPVSTVKDGRKPSVLFVGGALLGCWGAAALLEISRICFLLVFVGHFLSQFHFPRKDLCSVQCSLSHHLYQLYLGYKQTYTEYRV